MHRPLVPVLILLVLASVGVSAVELHTQPPPPAQDEFVPIDELDQAESLPAARFLITAYAVVWGLLLWYVWSLWRRLGRVERELADLQRQLQHPGRS